jgi:hypothetical protein
MQLDRRIRPQLAGEIFELDRQDIDDLERPPRRYAVRKARRQIAVGTGNLQRTARQM